MNRHPDFDALVAERALLLGCAIDSGDAAVAEMAGLLGYDIVWADLEHSTIDYRDAECFCRGARAGGALPLLRVGGSSREQILRALECGARIVVVPMVESAEVARSIVESGKFPPIGRRGFSGSSIGLSYGIGDKQHSVRWANQQTSLFVQIETLEGVRNCDSILAVPGIAGGLVGPADLSFSNGKPLDFKDPDLIRMFRSSVRAIRQQGKIAATATGDAGLIEAGLEEGLQIVICASETAGLRTYLEKVLQDGGRWVQSAERQKDHWLQLAGASSSKSGNCSE